MHKEIIHFSHANGFPAKSYSVLFNHLATQFDVGYIDRIAHDPGYPVTDNWPHLVEELIRYIEHHYHQPIIAVGHSMGGVLSYMVSLKRPDLFKGFIMLDAPVLLGIDAHVIGLSKHLGLIDRVTPAGRTVGRCESWPNKQAAIDYFKHKSLFKYTDARCLNDYVEYGTEPCDDGIRLRFKSETEIKLYRTLPHTLGRGSTKAAIPGAFIYGQQSKVVWPYQVRMMRQKAGVYTTSTVGSHLFPMEHPEKTAHAIARVVEKLSQWNQ